MNRVSEALRRAANEQVQPDTLSQEGSQEWVNGIEGEDPRTNGRFSAITENNETKAKRQYRKTIEELLFGRDLRNLKEYPLVALETNSAAAEQYKILREQVRKICSERKARVILITSPIKGDGKTTLTANLAAALALDYEEQVIVVDADMRSPSLHSYFDVKAGFGLSQFLVSKAATEPDDYVQDTRVRGLRILTAGKSSVHAAELLTADKMKKLLESLRQKFPGHWILIDGAPVLSTPDPLVLSRHVDGIVMVVRAGETPREYVSKAIKSLDARQLLGVILNGAELGVASKYYYPVRA